MAESNAKKIKVVAQVRVKKTAKNTLTEKQAVAFRRFLELWVDQHCSEGGGERIWSQRRIAVRLGITQNEYSNWKSGKTQPGLQRLLRLRETTGHSIEQMLGLEQG